MITRKPIFHGHSASITRLPKEHPSSSASPPKIPSESGSPIPRPAFPLSPLYLRGLTIPFPVTAATLPSLQRRSNCRAGRAEVRGSKSEISTKERRCRHRCLFKLFGADPGEDQHMAGHDQGHEKRRQ